MIDWKKDLKLTDAWRTGGSEPWLSRATYEFDKGVAKELDIYKEGVNHYRMTINFHRAEDGFDVKLYGVFDSGSFKEILSNDKVKTFVEDLIYEMKVEERKREYIAGVLERHKGQINRIERMGQM